MSRKSFWGISILLVVFLLLGMLVLGGCDTAPPDDDDDENGAPAPDPDPDPDPEPELKVLRVALIDAIRTNDPAVVRHRNSQTVMRNWTDGARNTLPDGSQHNDLAESITMIDEYTVEVTIRDDVYFHNGDNVTADDFVWNLTRQGVAGGMEGEDSPRRGNVGRMEKVEKIDDYTFRVHLENPNPNPRTFYNWDVHPKDYWEEVGKEGFLEHPIGCGPFKWVEGDFTSRIVLERYENYHGGLADQPGDVDRIPAVDRVEFIIIPEATTRVAALLAGDVDIIQAVPPDSVQLLQSNPNTQVLGQKGTTLQAIIFNTNKAPFNNRLVRQAVAHAIDVESIIEYQLLGFADNVKGLFQLASRSDFPFYRAFDDVLKPSYAYDPDQARALLADAGYADGFTTIIDTTSAYNEVAQAIAQMLGDVGIETSVRVWEPGTLNDVFAQGERDMYLGRIGDSSRSPWGALLGTTVAEARLNHGNYNNAEFEEMFWPVYQRGTDASPDVVEQWKEVHAFLNEDLPWVALYSAQVLEATRTNVKNYEPHDAGRILLYKVDIE